MNKNNLQNFLESYVGNTDPEIYEEDKKPTGYWKDFENVKKELDKIIKETGEFPTQTYLSQNGYASVMSGIGKYHGGLMEVRKKLGYEELPPQKVLFQNGFGSLCGAIASYHGGIRVFRETLNNHLGKGNSLESFLQEYIEN